MAFQIIRHAFAMIFNNFGQALRVSIGPYLLLVIAAVVVFGTVSSFEQLSDIASGNLPPEQLAAAGGSIVFGTLVLLILLVFVAAWVAVSWHRFILLEEYSGIIPAISGRPIWPYIGRSFVYGLVIGVFALILGFVVGLVTAVLFAISPSLGSIGAMGLGLMLGVVLSLLWFRIGVGLPAVAVGKPITMGEALAATAKINGTILGIGVTIVVVSMIAGVAVQGLYGISAILGFAVDLFVQWLTLMVGVSILTTLYGHVIEGRPLID